MRQCISGSGANTTSAMIAYLAANRQLLLADLVVLKTFVQGEEWSQYVKLTTADAPLRWDGLPYVDPDATPFGGTFAIGRLKRSNVDSKVGLDVQSLDIEWYLSDADIFIASPVTLTQLQAFAAGLWDNGRVYLYRTIMPAFGDCNTYGAMCMFAGRIADFDLTRTGVKLKINALTEVFDQQLPPNVIEPTNVMMKYQPGLPPPQIVGTQPPAWAAGTVYAPTFTTITGVYATMITDSNGNVQGCITGGTSGGSAPTWATAFGAPTTDGGVTWNCWGKFPVTAILQVQSGSTASEVIGSFLNVPSGGFVPNTFEQGYIIFTDYGAVNASMAQIARTVRWDNGSGVFHLLDPLPWAPEAGCYFLALAPYTRAANPTTTALETVPVDTSGPGYDYVTVPGYFVADQGVTYTDGSPLSLVDLATLELATSGGIYAVQASGGTAQYYFWTGGSSNPGGGGDAGATVYIKYQYEAPGEQYLGLPYVPAATNGA